MSEQEEWRVATSPTEWVTVKTADEAVRLGQRLAALISENDSLNHKLGRLLGAERQWVLVEPNEYARLTAENERLRKAGDELAKNLDWSWDASADASSKAEKAWKAAKEGRDAK